METRIKRNVINCKECKTIIYTTTKEEFVPPVIDYSGWSKPKYIPMKKEA